LITYRQPRAHLLVLLDILSAHANGNDCGVSTGNSFVNRAISITKKITNNISNQQLTLKEEKMSKLLERAFVAELTFRQKLTTIQQTFFARLKDERGDVPGWVLVVLMTTGLVTAIWTIAAPRLTAILKNSLDSINGIR
jgi:hypothetical protein